MPPTEPNTTITTTTTTTTTTTDGNAPGRAGTGNNAASVTGASDRAGLVGTITRVRLLDKKAIPFDNAGIIEKYHGYRFYCTYHVEKDGAGVETLVIEVGNAGMGLRPSAPKFPTTAATQAVLKVHYDSQTAAITKPVPVSYSGRLPLAISAQLASGSPWDKADVILTIEERDVIDDAVQAPGFVVTENKDANTFELRWIDNPFALAGANTSARPIPPGKGGGVVGPMGLETP